MGLPRTAALFLGLVGGAGCAVRGAPGAASVDLPAAHRGAPAPVAPAAPGAGRLSDVAWWDLFADPVLRSLVAEAVAANDDLEEAAARVLEARALAGEARAEGAPQVDGAASLGVESGGSRGPDARSTWSASFPVSWELDLWGRIRWSRRAAAARVRVAEEERNDLVRLLVADVAQAYLELRAFDEEIEVSRDTVRTRGRTRELFAGRFREGSGSELEVARSRAEEAAAAREVPDLERRAAQTEHRISLLLGRRPGPVPRGSVEPVLAPLPPADLPAALLRRRPDVRAAEAALLAAAADVGVARADLLPRVSLTALLGLESGNLADLVTSDAVVRGAGASLLGPIVDGGARRARLGAAWARWEEARAAWERTVRTALREVADALVAVDRLREVRARVEEQVAALEDAVRLSWARYEGKLAAYFEVLDAERELFPARRDLARTRRDQRVAVVTLYRALGGGWDPASAAAPACAPSAPSASPP